MASRLYAHRSITSLQNRKKKQQEEKRPPSSSCASTNSLSQQEQHQFLYQTIMENMAYYKALAKHQHRVATYLYHSFPDHKNHHILSRLTESGLSILQMQFAKKPKNPE